MLRLQLLGVGGGGSSYHNFIPVVYGWSLEIPAFKPLGTDTTTYFGKLKPLDILSGFGKKLQAMANFSYFSYTKKM
jgi:hypothetical protein